MKKRVVNLAAVTEAAAALADEHGLDQLTLAQLAARLEIKPPSLYNHVAGLPAVRRLLLLHGLREFAAQAGGAAVGKSGQAALDAMGRAMRDFARAHPGLYAATSQVQGPNDPELQGAGQAALRPLQQVMEGAGLRGDAAIHAMRTFRSAVHGFILMEAGGFGLPTEIAASFDWTLRNLGAALLLARAPDA